MPLIAFATVLVPVLVLGAVLVGCSAPSATCDAEAVGQESGPVGSIYRVENGELGPRCFGRQDETVEAAWRTLAEVAPPEVLGDVELFAGFETNAETLAFSGPIGEDNTRFAVAVDTRSVGSDAEELRLTLVHELAHVLAQTEDQLDTEQPAGRCETLWNGLGCFRPGSYLSGWIERFWSDEALATLPEDGAIDEKAGVERCLLDPTLVGSYAGSHPEEDFAETFAAWVFSVEVNEAVESKFEYLAQFPELVSVRDRARAAGLSDLENTFDRCG